MPKNSSATQTAARAKDWQVTEDLRPFDWQDKVVIIGSAVSCVVCCFLLWLPT